MLACCMLALTLDTTQVLFVTGSRLSNESMLFNTKNRIGVDRTLHRISKIAGLTYRIGRQIDGDLPS